MLRFFDAFQRLLYTVLELVVRTAAAMLTPKGWRCLLLEPKRKPEPKVSPQNVDAYVRHIVEIVPNADPTSLRSIVNDAILMRVDRVMEHAIEVLFRSPLDDTRVGGDSLELDTLQVLKNTVECACCFSECPFEEMVQCPEAHLFCSACMNVHASVLLSTNNPDIRCMDQSGCSAAILPSQLRRVLSAKLMDLWDRVKQQQNLEGAALENLWCCPFCDWGCIIEDDPGEILTCRNKNVCGVKSCRWCKKLDHRPNVCEVDSDKGRHHIDEAMSNALVRRCPGCQKPFIKDDGCNKMRCPNANCGTLSCYVCRQVVQGYGHFDSSPVVPGTRPKETRPRLCRLWDPVDEIHAEDVRVAAEKALKEYHAENTNTLKVVDVPPPVGVSAA